MFPSAHLLQCFSLCIVADHFLKPTLFLHLKFNTLTVIVKVLSYKNGANGMSDVTLIVAENRPNKVKAITFSKALFTWQCCKECFQETQD